VTSTGSLESENYSKVGALGLRTPWRIITGIDKNHRVIEFAESIPGKILLFALFCILVELAKTQPSFGCLSADRMLECLGFRREWIVITLLIAACAFAGKYRWWIVPIATGVVLYSNGFWFDPHLALTIAAQEGVANEIDFRILSLCVPLTIFLLSASVIYCARHFRRIFVFRRPIFCMIAFFITMVLVAASPVFHGLQRVVLWSFIGTFAAYFWFLGYALLDVSSSPPSVLSQLGTFHPFWGSTYTPFGKGVAYLKKFESKGPRELSVTQIKGLKLLMWVVVLTIAQRLFIVSTHRYFGFPTFEQAFAAQIAGVAYPWYTCWGSLVAFFVEDLLQITIFGGIIVSCARMAGFRLLRNTYRPLESRTIAEFWNRYYFYYKELLVDFFFYPTFLRCFRKHKRLRLFFATFMAACIGNMLYHFMRDIHFAADLGVAGAVIGYQSHAFYTFLLALGIAASQMRPRQPSPSAGWLSRLFVFIRIAGFFCILHVFDAPLDREHFLWERFLFLFHIFGVDRWL
jgi:hypothetical protein